MSVLAPVQTPHHSTTDKPPKLTHIFNNDEWPKALCGYRMTQRLGPVPENGVDCVVCSELA